MKATKIVSRKVTYTVKSSGESLRVIVEVWKIFPPEGDHFPDGLKFSIVAFLESAPGEAVIIDCHPPKGPHFHFGGKEVSFPWEGLDKAETLFWELVEKKFGPVKES